MILESLSLWIAETNSWIISADDRECVIIDIPPDPRAVIARLQALQLRPVAIIATHGHADHVGGMTSFLELEEADGTLGVHIHPDDKHMLVNPVDNAPSLGTYLQQAGVALTPPEIIVDLNDGDRISGSGLTFEVIHTPGHTRGSVCLDVQRFGTDHLLFSGDHLFKDSIGRTDLPGGSYEELMTSMKERILPMPDEVQVLPGHGPRTTIGRERAMNPFLRGAR